MPQLQESILDMSARSRTSEAFGEMYTPGSSTLREMASTFVQINGSRRNEARSKPPMVKSEGP